MNVTEKNMRAILEDVRFHVSIYENGKSIMVGKIQFFGKRRRRRVAEFFSCKAFLELIENTEPAREEAKEKIIEMLNKKLLPGGFLQGRFYNNGEYVNLTKVFEFPRA